MKAEVVILYQNRETTQEEATTGPLGFSYCHPVTPAFDHQPRLHEKELHLSFLKIQILGAMFVKATLTILSDLLTNNETLSKLDYFIVRKRMSHNNQLISTAFIHSLLSFFHHITWPQILIF